MEDINALELLKEEMSTEEIYLKVNAIHRLKIVVLCLGPSDTQNLLLPYLESKKIENLKFNFSGLTN
jgi:serine/threonine-protein phosphatase 2A regulatory subunit A